ncbi:MAG: 5'-nucleotidase [Bacteroidota bacterium]
MRYIFFFMAFGLLCLLCCKNDSHLNRIEGKRISISDSLVLNTEIDSFIKPYRDHVNKGLDSVLAYAEDTYSKYDGHLNTAIGNLMADAILQECNPIFKARTGESIDAVLMNHGGIRSIISKGDITTRTAFEIMPFENYAVVVALKGKKIDAMFKFLAKDQKAHPISGIQLSLNKDFTIQSANIQGQPIDTTKVYHVVTTDYQYNGGDNMNFLRPNEGMYNLDYKIRNILIDHFKKADTISPKADDRFIQLNN